MVLALAIGADALLGVGWVLQAQVAARNAARAESGWRLLRGLVKTPLWWGGIAAMALGQSLAAWALQAGAVAVVEPLLVGCLLFAFAFAAWHGIQRVSPGELLGTLVVVVGVALFLGAARPRPDLTLAPRLWVILAATAAATGLAALLVSAGRVIGRRRHPAGESAAFAAAAGVMYALQDVSTRGAIDVARQRNLVALVGTAWPYALLGAATAGVLISQAAFRAARLDWSLPPTVAAQPIIGVAMGVALLGDRLRWTTLSAVIQAVGVPLTLIGLVIVGRSPILRHADRFQRREAADRGGARVAPSVSPRTTQ